MGLIEELKNRDFQIRRIYQKIGIIKRFLGTSILKNYIFIVILVFLIAGSAFLNFNAESMSGLIPAYEDFGKLFKSGIDLDDPQFDRLYTFPMWGYGIFYAFGFDRVSIVVIQCILSIAAIVLLVYILKLINWKRRSQIITRYLVLFSFPYFMLHGNEWPYSPGSSILIMSISLLILALYRGSLIITLLSSLAAGLMLHFRSDYYLLCVGLFFLLLLYSITTSRFKTWYTFLWILLIHIALLPWSSYSKKKSDHYLFSSTNGGHVLFISLGQLPQNTWQITRYDKDSAMNAVLKEHLGTVSSTLNYKADSILKKEWWTRIKSNPNEFIRKCLYNINQIWKRPFYRGEIGPYFNKKDPELGYSKRDSSYIVMANSFVENNFILNISHIVFWTSNFFGLFFTRLFFLLTILYLLYKRLAIFRDPVFLIVGAVIYYQILLMVIAYFMPQYNSNIAVFYIVGVSYLLTESGLGLYIYEKIKRLLFKLLEINKTVK